MSEMFEIAYDDGLDHDGDYPDTVRFTVEDFIELGLPIPREE